MNKKLLALTLGAVAALPLTAQAEGPTLYGKMNVTLDSIEDTAAVTDAWYLNSNASRLGIKGESETGVASLKGIYQAEYEIDVAGDAATPFAQRNIYVGLKGGFGTVRMGKFDTPLKEAQGKVDQFNDLNGDIKNIMPGETRAANIVQYSTPKLADMLTINVALMPAENTDVDGQAGNEDGIADSVSASLLFESGAFYAALAMDSNMPGKGFVDSLPTVSDRADIIRLVAGYKADSFELGAIVQAAEEVGTGAAGEDKAVLLSAAMKSGDWKFKAQYGKGEGDVNGETKTLAALGADYKLGKSTTLFVYGVNVEKDLAATEVKTLGLGIEQKF